MRKGDLDFTITNTVFSLIILSFLYEVYPSDYPSGYISTLSFVDKKSRSNLLFTCVECFFSIVLLNKHTDLERLPPSSFRGTS